jgi:hypothetical protein
MRVVKFLSATLLGCGLLAQTAGASPMPCMLHDDLVKLLDTKYQEELNGYGIAGQRNLVEVFFGEGKLHRRCNQCQRIELHHRCWSQLGKSDATAEADRIIRGR